jgi:hypothetical protein
MDQCPYREEAQGALRESVEFLKGIDALLDNKAMEELRSVVKEGNPVRSCDWVRSKIFKNPF